MMSARHAKSTTRGDSYPADTWDEFSSKEIGKSVHQSSLLRYLLQTGCGSDISFFFRGQHETM